MPAIAIRRAHQGTLRKAKTLVNRIARYLADEYDVTSEWHQHVLHFERPGVSGTIAVGSEFIDIEVELGLMFNAFRARIEREINEQLDGQMPPVKASRSRART
jgi:putative polyhydroxyalkanoate system protein